MTSKKDRQQNGQKKNKDKRTNNDMQNTTQKPNNQATRSPLKIGEKLRKGK
jgi:mannose-6-phosphate isomerase-like protein (cupin superfamily)